jgi:fimbrial isopeptide formation D2 family protein/LPXTG-motif cell wall-anchored protein
MKKLTALVLALMLVLSMALSVSAEETFTITIPAGDTHQYEIYQIFTGKVSQENDKTILTDVLYGMNYYPHDGTFGGAVSQKDLEDFMSLQDPVGYLDTAISGDPMFKEVNKTEKADTISIADVPAGYYLIEDVTSEEDLVDGETLSQVILYILDDIAIASKHALITSEKLVYDVNDSGLDPAGEGWFDAADHDIGDDVPFQLSVTIPSTYSTYEDYTLTFHDVLSAGFDAPDNADDFTVYILKADNITKIEIPQANGGASGFTYHRGCSKRDTCEFEGLCSFNVTIGDLNDLYGTRTFAEGDKLIVEYTAKLNSNAHIGKDSNQAHNENGMYVCHPDGHTPKDYVRVLTYKLTINKIDGADQQPLTGAGFTLYKMDKDGTYNPVAVGENTEGAPIFELAGSGMTTFTWTGIDGGRYKLVETTVPAGYNSLADIEFIVDATHATNWEKGTNAAFYNLIAKDAAGKTVFADQDANGLEDGILEGNVENHKGAALPETGAEGTFFLITGSTLLVMVAAVFMITRKKMSIYED